MAVRTTEGPRSDEPERVIEIVVRGSKMGFLACAAVNVKIHGYLSRIDGRGGIRAVKIESH